VRETHFASLALDLPSREVAGDELTILGSFVNNAEGRPALLREFHHQNLNGNFDLMNQTGSWCARHLRKDSDSTIGPWGRGNLCHFNQRTVATSPA
jgi:hypothetical protein